MSLYWIQDKYVGKYNIFCKEEMEYLDYLSSQYRKPYYRPLDIFPQGKKIIIKSLKDNIKQLKSETLLYNIGDLFSEVLNELKKESIIRYISKLKTLTYKKKGNSITPADVEVAKKYSIYDILGIANHGYKLLSIKCPLHDDQDPSFVIYNEKNTWYCFGCNEGSDSIDLYMKLNKVSFIDAVKYLINK